MWRHAGDKLRMQYSIVGMRTERERLSGLYTPLAPCRIAVQAGTVTTVVLLRSGHLELGDFEEHEQPEVG